MPEYCTAEADGRILTVTINRPEVMNSLHPMANVELGKIFDDFDANPDLVLGPCSAHPSRSG